MISQRARYAFKALLALTRVPPGQSLQIREISEREGIPRAFLEHILLDLKRLRIVASRRGKAGGYFLVKAPEALTFGDILWHIDGPMAPLGCLSRQAYRRCEDCPDEAGCALRAGFSGIFQTHLQALEGMTFARALEKGEAKRTDGQGYGHNAYSGADI
jgi:Rrf2 family protein